MREMLKIWIGTPAMPGAVQGASEHCRSHNFSGAFVQRLDSFTLAFAMEDMTWKTLA